MARQRKLSPERKAFINSLIEHYQPKDMHYLKQQSHLCMLFQSLIALHPCLVLCRTPVLVLRYRSTSSQTVI